MPSTSAIIDCEIGLIGTFAARGFGFSCLKRANELALSGSLQYQSSDCIFIHLQGERDSVDEFYRWCQNSPETQEAERFITPAHEKIDLDFKIINAI